jgi:hypothetical protein
MTMALRLIHVPDYLGRSFHCIEGCNVLKLAIAVEVLCSPILFVSANFRKCFIKGHGADCSLYCTRAGLEVLFKKYCFSLVHGCLPSIIHGPQGCALRSQIHMNKHPIIVSTIFLSN